MTESTKLLDTCRKGDIFNVKRLLSQVRNPAGVRDQEMNTLLHYSCRHGWLDVTSSLVEKYHCNPESRNQWNDTPLHVACHKGHVSIVKYLVSEQRFSTACRNGNGDTPLHVACHKGHVSIVKYLVSEQRFSTACRNENGNTPLHIACREGHLAMAQIFLTVRNCSTACLSKNYDGETVLHYSCQHGCLDVTKRLVEQHHCDPESRDKDGDTPLHVACHKGHVDIVSYLVSEQRCSTAFQNEDGDTPLHVACHMGHVNIVRYLVSEQGCSTACRNGDGNTPLHVACREGHQATAEVLLTGQNCSTACLSKGRYGATVLHYSCYHGWLDVTRRLVEQYHCDPESRDKDGDTSLHVACCKGHVDIVKYLVSAQGCNIACQNMDGDTPLHVACRAGFVYIVRYLVSEQGCSTAFQNKEGDSSLHVACHVGHEDIVRYLVSEQGCSTACQNKNGDTPLHEACRMDRINVVHFILSTGRADPWCKNARNITPVQLTYSYEISKLFAGLTKPNRVTAIKVFIFGNPAVGKSTLVKVIENKVSSLFGALAGQFRNVSGVELKTAGINTVTIQNSRLGILTIYDLAGQFEYYSSHDALVENLMSSSTAILMVVVKFNESEAEVIQTLRYWMSFIENCCSRVEASAHLIVVGSWADKVKEAIDQKWLSIKKACISSTSSLHFVGFTSLDCCKLASSGLDKICDMIGSSCTALREAAEQKEIIYPHLLHAFITNKLSSEIACSVKKLCTQIREENDALLPTEPNLLSPLLSSLSDRGHLLYLPNTELFEAGWIVINKQVVLSEVNGTVFAPEYFQQHHDIATSTGVVPKSKIAGVFAKKYNIDMILCVLTAFEFCQKIKDFFTLSLIASSDPSRDGAATMTTSNDSSESYYFFPALVQVEHPTDVWQSSGPEQYQCGWCLQCSKEGQYLTPRFLHVLLLRLAFSFALAPDSSQQDEASPVLRRRCAIWKNGIQWRDRDDVHSRVEVVEQSQTVLMLMCCPEKRAMSCVKLRSSLIRTILNCQKELCPAVDTNEFLIDPSNLSQHQLGSTKELTTYSMADVVKAVQECKPCALDRTGEKSLDLEIALHFEPYLDMHKRLIDQMFDKDLANQEVDTNFLHDLAESIHPKLTKEDPKAMKKMLQMFNISDSRLFYSYCEQYPNEKDNPVMRCFRLLLTWKNCDAGGSTYQSLCTTLDKYSIFCGRNPMVISAGSGVTVDTDVENSDTQ